MGSQMARHKWELHREINMGHQMYDSPAFRELSRGGMLVLMRFLQKRKWTIVKRKRIYENSGIAFTFEEARDHIGIKSKSAWLEILKKLYALGFIDIEHQGGIAGDHDKSIYALCERWRKYGTDEFVKLEKPRVLWPGHDVRSWMELKEGTVKRTGHVRSVVPVEQKDAIMGGR